MGLGTRTKDREQKNALGPELELMLRKRGFPGPPPPPPPPEPPPPRFCARPLEPLPMRSVLVVGSCQSGRRMSLGYL